MSDQIRTAALESGLTGYSMAKACGFTRWSMYRFLRGDGGMTLDHIDALAEHLDINIAETGKPVSA